MNVFRNVAGTAAVANWYDNGYHMIAFSRGNRGFIAINNDPSNDMNIKLQTGMAAGSYCDVISGNKVGSSCTDKVITVNSDGTTTVSIGRNDADPMIAIHADSKIN